MSRVETLGYWKLQDVERQHLIEFFEATVVLPLSDAVLDMAIQLRQLRKMTLGDVLVAATAIVFRQDLATRNTKDFDWIENLVVIDPVQANQ